MSERLNIKTPVIKETRISRRTFLKGSVITLVSLALASYQIGRKPESETGNTVKFLLLTDVHAGKNGFMSRMLYSVFRYLKSSEFDHIYQLGDMIPDSESENESISNLESGLKPFTGCPISGTHLVGNHDIWNLPLEQLSETYLRMGLNSKFFGVEEYGDLRIVYLDMEAKKGKNGSLPKERIEWLRKTIYPGDTPTIIFSHEGLVSQDVSDNTYFKDNPDNSFLANGPKVWEAVKDLNILAVISGHLHSPANRLVDGKTQMVSIPAFIDRGAYSILKVDGTHLTLNSLCGTKCIFTVKT